MEKIILASGSPRRKQLLKILDLEFDIIIPDVDESAYKAEGSPKQYCSLLAEMKGQSVSMKYPGHLVISSDTIVVLDKHIIGKPKNLSHAKTMLRALSGRAHKVYTAVSMKLPAKNVDVSFTECTEVTFRDLRNGTIQYYLDHYPPLDKAGSYGIQDFSAVFVDSIIGCYHNVMGFPISRFYDEVKKSGLDIFH